MRKALGLIAVTITSAVLLATPALARDHDRDDYRRGHVYVQPYVNNYNYGYTDPYAYGYNYGYTQPYAYGYSYNYPYNNWRENERHERREHAEHERREHHGDRR